MPRPGYGLGETGPLAPAMCAGQNKPSRQSEVAEVLEYQEKALSRLENIVDQLHGRLGTILRNQQPPAPVDPSNKVELQRVPLAERLASHNFRLRLINDALESMIERVEL